MYNFNCQKCQKPTSKKDKNAKFCSLKCANTRKVKPDKEAICNFCSNIFKRKEYKLISKTGYLFCSTVCRDKAQTYNNGTRILQTRLGKLISLKKSELIGKTGRIRICAHANAIYKINSKPYECYICSYSLYTEVAHIKPVSCFSEDCTLEEINHIDNLVRLCPNHHKELDVLNLFCLII